MEKAVQNFFMQILPPTFLCMTTGPCRSVTQSYANCLRNNSPSWKTFYGTEPKEMAAKLRTAILKYRIIEKTIDKLHRCVRSFKHTYPPPPFSPPCLLPIFFFSNNTFFCLLRHSQHINLLGIPLELESIHRLLSPPKFALQIDPQFNFSEFVLISTQHCFINLRLLVDYVTSYDGCLFTSNV